MMDSSDQHTDLQAYNTLSVPAKAKAFISVSSVDALKKALLAVKNNDEQLLILGSGSNVVLPDFFNGLVIHMAMQGRKIEQETQSTITVSFAAGEVWHEIVMWSVQNGWFGIENLALIPGTVGAAPVQNIGAYGVELKDRFAYLEAVHLQTGELKRFTHGECDFSYRESIFKQALKHQWVITRVALTLSKVFQACLDYPALKNALGDVDEHKLTSHQIAHAIIGIRQSKLPDPKKLPNAGSFFKNPIIDNAHFAKLIKDYPTIAHYSVSDSHTKIAAGWLLEQDGWKGKLIDGVGMHKKQALVLTNPNSLPAENIIKFSTRLQSSIQKKFNITLEIEPIIIQPSTVSTAFKSGEDCA